MSAPTDDVTLVRLPVATVETVTKALWDCLTDYLEDDGYAMSAERNVQVVDALALVKAFWPRGGSA